LRREGRGCKQWPKIGVVGWWPISGGVSARIACATDGIHRRAMMPSDAKGMHDDEGDN